MVVTEQTNITGGTSKEIAAAIEGAVTVGELPRGAALPTIRSLARSLDVSPTTVAAAYRRLQVRGIIGSEGRRGTRVNHRPPLPLRSPDVAPTGARNLVSGNPDPDLLPDITSVFNTLSRRALYGEEMNSPRLIGLASDAFAADGIPPGPVAVVGGALDGIERVLGAHLLPGDRVAVEDPGFTRVLDLVAALGLVAEPVDIDGLGMVPDRLERALASGVRAAIVTPRAQNPTGAAFDERRAEELRQVLGSRRQVLVVEDDHASTTSGATLFSLCRDRARWAVVRSVSKTLGPDLRVAVMTGDETTVARVAGRQLLGTGWVSRILQDVVAGLWSSRRVKTLLRRAAATYAERRVALVSALAARGIEVQAASGYNVWIPVADEGAIVAELRKRSWAVARGEPFRLRSGPAIRVTAATLTGEESERFASDLEETLEPARLRTYA
jgi:DNA-binding transcriptional MocR family regulator